MMKGNKKTTLPLYMRLIRHQGGTTVPSKGIEGKCKGIKCLNVPSYDFSTTQKTAKQIEPFVRKMTSAYHGNVKN